MFPTRLPLLRNIFLHFILVPIPIPILILFLDSRSFTEYILFENPIRYMYRVI